MKTTENTIVCPKCGAKIDVNQVLYQQLEEQIKASYEKQLAEDKKVFQKQLDELRAAEEKLKEEKEKFDSQVEQQVRLKLKEEAQKLKETLRQELDKEKSDELEMLQKELNLKSEQLRELNKTKAEIERLKREKEELAEKIMLEKEREFSQKLLEEKQKIRQQIEESNILKIKELEKLLEEQKEMTRAALRKAEQGSVQRQGEIQELELENILRETHKYDEIVVVKQGQRGADVIQIVRNEFGAPCGKIYYESKRTKEFNVGWIKKLKEDNKTEKADILVLVTETMPDGHSRFFLMDDVWVCNLWEVQGLSIVLRHGLLQVHAVSVVQHGKESKMELLYNYLTSREFADQFGAIIEGYKAILDGYNEEKYRLQKIWKEREKQLDNILTNAAHLYGSIKAIAGASAPRINLLEDGQSNALEG